MRFAPVLLALGSLLSIAGAQSNGKAIQAQTAPTPARVALERMSPAERANARISVEFESSDDEAVALGRQVERLWNGGQYDEALAQLDNLEAMVGRVAIGNSWRKPVPTVETHFWGSDIRIGNRDSLLDVALDVHNPSDNLFVVLRHNAAPPHFSVCMSTDGGWTWGETFTWSGSPPASTDGTVLGNHFYVVYNSPGENAQQVRLRRFLCGTGRAEAFPGGVSWVVPCTLDVGDTMKEVSLVSNQGNNRLYIVALASDGSVLVSYDDANALSWTKLPTGITSGASSGLDATGDQSSDTTYLFCSYYDTSDTLRIYGWGSGGFEQRFSLLAGRGTPTSISAYWGTVICAHEDETSSPHRVGHAVSHDSGNTWTTGILGDTGIAADAPAVTVSGSDFAAVCRSSASTTELLFCQRTDSGSWSDPVSVAENAPSHSRPGIIRLGPDVYGVAYLSDTSPVVRGAYFDRSDWVYGVAEEGKPQATSHKLQATVIRGVLLLLRLETGLRTGHDPKSAADFGHVPVSRASLRDIYGRKVLDLHAGANDVSGLSSGVYFVRSAQAEAVRKFVVTR